MFRKSLADLVRGIRSHKKDENEYINKCLQEIKEELRLVNKKAKMVAVQKLTYVGNFIKIQYVANQFLLNFIIIFPI